MPMTNVIAENPMPGAKGAEPAYARDDPAAELKDLRKKLAEKTTAAEKAGADAKSLSIGIDALERQIKEVERLAKAIAEKKAAYAKEKLHEFVSDSLKSLRGALEAVDPGRAAKADKAIADFDGTTAEMSAARTKLEAEWKAKADNAIVSESKLASAKIALDDAYKLSDAIGKQIDSLKALRTRITQADGASDHVAAYVLAKQASAEDGAGNGLVFPDMAALTALLSQLRKDWYSASTALAAAKHEEALGKAVLDSKTKELADRVSGRLELLIDAARKA